MFDLQKKSVILFVVCILLCSGDAEKPYGTVVESAYHEEQLEQLQQAENKHITGALAKLKQSGYNLMDDYVSAVGQPLYTLVGEIFTKAHNECKAFVTNVSAKHLIIVKNYERNMAEKQSKVDALLADNTGKRENLETLLVKNIEKQRNLALTRQELNDAQDLIHLICWIACFFGLVLVLVTWQYCLLRRQFLDAKSFSGTESK